jgi:hypothetical protein
MSQTICSAIWNDGFASGFRAGRDLLPSELKFMVNANEVEPTRSGVGRIYSDSCKTAPWLNRLIAAIHAGSTRFGIKRREHGVSNFDWSVIEAFAYSCNLFKQRTTGDAFEGPL